MTGQLEIVQNEMMQSKLMQAFILCSTKQYTEITGKLNKIQLVYLQQINLLRVGFELVKVEQDFILMHNHDADDETTYS